MIKSFVRESKLSVLQGYAYLLQVDLGLELPPSASSAPFVQSIPAGYQLTRAWIPAGSKVAGIRAEVQAQALLQAKALPYSTSRRLQAFSACSML
jgi:hypothetical protein